MELFAINPINLWGDYGDVLISGFSRRDALDGPALLERSGPYLPPISFPGNIIILSDGLKLKLEASFAGQFGFRKAVYKKIVPIDWHLWNRAADLPEQRPVEGEPENYLEEGKHSPKTAQSMEVSWELILQEFLCVADNMIIDPTNPHRAGRAKTLFVERLEYPGIFRSSCGGERGVVDPVMKAWLHEHASEWVRFYPLAVVHDPHTVQRLTDQRNYFASIRPHLSPGEYRELILALCKKHSYMIPPGFYRPNISASRYCIICTDVMPPKLSAQSYDDYYGLENYLAHRRRISFSPENALSQILIYDLETGNQLKRLGPGKFVQLAG